MTDPSPPSLLEIVGLPLVGAALIDVFRTRDNELVLLSVPFLVAVFRLFIAQFQVPPLIDPDVDERASRAARSCIAINQFAVLVLILVEVGAVIASDPAVPTQFRLIVVGIFLAYVVMRLTSRRYWLIAAGVP